MDKEVDLTRTNVVIVVDEDAQHFQEKGEVVGVFADDHEDGPIEVAIEKLRQRYAGGIFDTKRGRELGYGYRFRFFSEQLKLSGYDLEERMIKLFGKDVWAHYKIEIPLDPEKECMVKNCTNLQETEAITNCCDFIYQLYVCPHCYGIFHGQRVPSIAI